MEALSQQGYLEFHPDTLEVVRRGVGLHRPGEMADAVRILDDWVQQQDHFIKKDIHPVYVETLIVSSKGSLERAKVVLEKMCRVRTQQHQYFDLYDVQKTFQILKGKCYALSLPRPTAEHQRVLVARFVGKFGEPGLMDCVYKFVYTCLDYQKRYDYSSGTTLIYDVLECDLKDILTNVNLMDIKNCYVNIMENYAFRVKRIHLITASKVANTLINFFKQFLKKKIVDRLVVHESFDALHQFYPKHILPKEYGGTEKSLDELQEDYLTQLTSEDFRAYQKNMADMRVDEARLPRTGDDVTSNGTFRALSID